MATYSFSHFTSLRFRTPSEGKSSGHRFVPVPHTDGDGEDAVLRRQGREEGAVDAGGGQAARRLRPGQWVRQLAPAPQARR
jgi:hypothetical protein